MIIKKVYSKRLKRDVWSVCVQIGGKKYRQAKWDKKSDAEKYVSELRRRHSERRLNAIMARISPAPKRSIPREETLDQRNYTAIKYLEKDVQSLKNQIVDIQNDLQVLRNLIFIHLERFQTLRDTTTPPVL